MGIDSSTFRVILAAGFGRRWCVLPIFSPRYTQNEKLTSKEEVVGCGGGLGVILHWLSSKMQQWRGEPRRASTQ